jgi:penicillin-binding protein 1C
MKISLWQKKWKRKHYLYMVVFVLLMVSYYFILPEKLFKDPYTTVLLAKDGELLSASIAPDGQWRFPESHEVPEKFSKAIVLYEDKRFWSHPGVDILSLGRAVRQNLRAGRIESGGSTLSMQVIRLSRGSKARTFFEKAIEMIMATRLEWRYSKEEILSLYVAHAPFGGNVVGLDAACWRYFSRDSKDLSWGEAALLAVLPNAPSLIHPGKNRPVLKRKRDKLLDRLYVEGIIDSLTCAMSKEESIPDAPIPLPRHARHLILRSQKDGLTQTTIQSTIDINLQQRLEQILGDHQRRLHANFIHNAAVLVAEVNTGNVLAYAGNINGDEQEGADVDITSSPRSTGSILKPILYTAMLDEGKILPKTLLPDIPVYINGFSPKNFSHDFDGAVHADKALIRSLNIPAVHMLRDYRYEKFHNLLKQVGLTTLTQPPDHYGLSLILGGAEGTLWDITGIYASMARTLNNYFTTPGQNRYRRTDFHPLRYIDWRETHNNVEGDLEETGWLSAGSIYQAFDALKELYRPGEGSGWKQFSSSKRIAWKTGTSFGFRDGWAVGVTPDYVVGVWVGNADSEGRAGLTGTEAAAPVMFDVFSLLPESEWFEKPEQEMAKITTCARSGYRSTAWCDVVDTLWVMKSGLQTLPCPYHKQIHVTVDLKYQVNTTCEAISNIRQVSWFILPPVQEYYFRPKNLSYRMLPDFRSDCKTALSTPSMDVIYPKANAKVFIPRGLDGRGGHAVFQVAHQNPHLTIFWHLDGVYLGSTQKSHHMPIQAAEGRHKLTLIDEKGATLEQSFEVLSKF